jgi:hypothetical protein
MTTQQTEPLVLPDVTWGYTPDTGQLMAQCGDHEAEIHRDPKNGQPVFHLTIRDCEHEDGSPRAKEMRSRQGVAETRREWAMLMEALIRCRDMGYFSTPHTPALENNLCLVALLGALVEYGRKGR